MSILRLAVPAVVVAAALAGSFTYFVSPPPPVEAEQRSAAPAREMTSTAAGTPVRIAQDRRAEDFLRAAEAILRPLSNAQASVRTDELPIMGHIPLPKRRPIPW
jgi:uncharacterized membrane protein